METLFSGRAIVGDREWSYVSVIPAIRRSWAIKWKLGFNYRMQWLHVGVQPAGNFSLVVFIKQDVQPQFRSFIKLI